MVAMKPYFGADNVYGHAYGLLPGQIDTVGNPPPYQVSAAISTIPSPQPTRRFSPTRSSRRPMYTA